MTAPPAVVLLPGRGGAARDLGELSARLAAEYRPVVVELDGVDSVEAAVDVLAAAVADAEPAGIVGFSLGGIVAAAYAAAHRDAPPTVNLDGFGLAGVERLLPDERLVAAREARARKWPYGVVDGVDVLSLVPQTQAPLLMVVATASGDEREAAHAAAVVAALRAQSSVELATVDARHGDLPHREDVAALVLDFLGKRRR